MSQILCSTGAVIGRANGRDYRLLAPLSRELSCDGFELMIYGAWYDEMDAMLRWFEKAGFTIPVLHCDKQVGSLISKGSAEEIAEACRLFSVNCRAAEVVGAGKMVLHLWGGRASDGKMPEILQVYPRIKQTAEQHGLDLLIENVVCNVEHPMKHWLELREIDPDVHFVFDTKMAAFHQQEELIYQDEYAWLWQEAHIRHYHVNDYGGGYMDWSRLATLPIARGRIDWAKFFAFLKGIGYQDTFTVEATALDDAGRVDTVMLNEQFSLIRNALETGAYSKA